MHYIYLSSYYTWPCNYARSTTASCLVVGDTYVLDDNLHLILFAKLFQREPYVIYEIKSFDRKKISGGLYRPENFWIA